MTRSSPFILDRAIPLYPGLASFLDYLPGVDKAARQRRSKKTGKVSPVTMTTRGMIRALVIVQLDHRLRDNPADRDLLVRDGVIWYARSYASWHWWDFRMFMSQPTMTRAFQQLAAAGYIRMRKQTDFVTPDMPLTEAKVIQKVMHVYNGLAWSIDYEKLETAMAASPGIQEYYASREPLLASEGSDQADQTRAGSDQADRTPAISLIRQVRSGRSDLSDQPDQTGLISLIRDQQSLDQTPDQNQTESSAAAADAAARPPDSVTGADENKRANVGAPGGPAGNGAPPLYQQLDNDQRITYSKLIAHHVDPEDAADIAQHRDPGQIDAWLDYIRRANTPGSELSVVRNPGGYLVKMLAHPDNYPRPKKEKPAGAARFTSGPYSDEIKT